MPRDNDAAEEAKTHPGCTMPLQKQRKSIIHYGYEETVRTCPPLTRKL